MLTVLSPPLWQHSPVLTLSLDQMVGWSECGRTLHGWGWNPDLQGPPSIILCLSSCCCRSVEGAVAEALAWVLTCHCTEAAAVLWAPVCAGCALSSKTAARTCLLRSGPWALCGVAKGPFPEGCSELYLVARFPAAFDFSRQIGSQPTVRMCACARFQDMSQSGSAVLPRTPHHGRGEYALDLVSMCECRA